MKTKYIIVNGQNFNVPVEKKEISYKEIVEMAAKQKNPEMEFPENFFSVMFHKGPAINKQGILGSKETVMIKNKMCFTAVNTVNA